MQPRYVTIRERIIMCLQVERYACKTHSIFGEVSGEAETTDMKAENKMCGKNYLRNT
jgi:hypothetical protein